MPIEDIKHKIVLQYKIRLNFSVLKNYIILIQFINKKTEKLLRFSVCTIIEQFFVIFIPIKLNKQTLTIYKLFNYFTLLCIVQYLYTFLI